MSLVSHDARVEAVQEALAARGRAVVAGDATYLETILAPEFKHVHATGRIEPRRDYLASIRSGKAKFVAIEPSQLTVDVYETAAVIFGDIYIAREVDGRPAGRTSRFVSVWHDVGGTWKLVHWQMTGKQEGV